MLADAIATKITITIIIDNQFATTFKAHKSLFNSKGILWTAENLLTVLLILLAFLIA